MSSSTTDPSDSDHVPVETVEDSAGNEKRMVGRPAGLKDFDIPTGDKDIDWRCPLCKEVGYYSRTGYPNPTCTNTDCRVDRYSPFVGDLPSNPNH